MMLQKLIGFVLILLLFPWFLADVQAEISWTVIGPGGGGGLNTIEISPHNSGVVYVGCDVGGIYRSTDNGKSWQIINNGLTNYDIQDIAIDPQTPATLYAATEGGVFKSTDNGESWVIKRNGFPPTARWSFSAPVAKIAIDPHNPNIIYAGIGIPNDLAPGRNVFWTNVQEKGLIYKSTDYGESWSKIQNSGININAMIYSMAIDPNDSTVLYITTEYGIYKSTDAGNTWQSKNTGLPHLNSRDIIIDPTNSDVLYVTIWATPGSDSWEGGVYKSTDAGESWVAKNDGLAQAMGGPSENVFYTSNYPGIVMNPQDSQVLYVANDSFRPNPGIFKTTDGGEHWTWVTRDTGTNINIEPGWIDWTTPATYCLAIDPGNPDRIFFGNLMILCKTEDAGESWVQAYTDSIGSGYWRGRGFETTEVFDITVDPANSNNVYLGYVDMGFLKSTDGGISFKSTGKTGNNWLVDAYVIVVDPAESSILYAATGVWTINHGEIRKSTDYGETWNVISDYRNGLPNAQIFSLVIDPNNAPDSRILYAASYGNGIYKTTDGGVSWFPVNNGLGINRNIRKIVIDPANSNILYAGIESYTENNNGNWSTVQGGIYKTSDGGQNWIRMDTNPPQPGVYDLAINPTNSNIIYSAVRETYDHSQLIMYRGGVYKSTDGGNSWIELSSGFGDIENLNVGTLAINSQNPDIIYAGTFDRTYHDECPGRGIFKSTNGGLNWTPINSGLSNLIINIITIDPSDPSRLYVGTSGNGAFTGIDNLTNIDEKDIQIPEKYYIEQNYPNPFNPTTTISYALSKSSFVKLSIYDINGRLVETLVNENKTSGYYTVVWNAEKVASGIYFYRINAGEYSFVKKCLLVK